VKRDLELWNGGIMGGKIISKIPVFPGPDLVYKNVL
jgi:hypothetical protein